MASVSDLTNLISPKFNEAVLKDIIFKKNGYKNCEINSIKLGPESKKGDSYLSTVTRFSVNFTGKDEKEDKKQDCVNVIAKSLPKNIGRRKTFRSVEFFTNEIAFYNEVWSKLTEFQKLKLPNEPLTIIPKCLATFCDNNNAYIALEDISFDGFGNVDRSTGFDINHAKLVLNVFAKFHALSLAYRDQHPAEFEIISNKLQETYFSEAHRKWYLDFQNILSDIVRDAVAKELPPKYLEHLKKLHENNFFETICDSCCEKGPLTAITHGDAWIPNFLLKYDTKTHSLLEAVTIDFQLTRTSSVALDLHFFFYACLDQNILENHYDELIDYYRVQTVSYLKKLGSSEKLLPMESIMNDMKKHIAFAIGMSTEAQVMSLLEDDEVSDIDLIQGEEAVPIVSVWIVKPMKTQEKRKRIAAIVKHAVDYGYF